MEDAVEVNEAVVFALLMRSERELLPLQWVGLVPLITSTAISAVKNAFVGRGIIISAHALQKVPLHLVQARRSGRARLSRRRYIGIDA